MYDFYQASPGSSNPETLKFYFIQHSSKDLFEDIAAEVPDTQYSVDDYSPDDILNQNFVDLVDGKTYRFSGRKIFFPGDMPGNCFGNPNCAFTPVPDDFSMEILFTHNSSDNSFTLKTPSPTSCGNTFEFIMKPHYGSSPSFQEMQTWEISPNSTGNFVADCSEVEAFFYESFGLACSDLYDERIAYKLISLDGIIRFQIYNVFGGELLLEFRDINLGLQDSVLSDVILFQIKGSELIRISNPNQLNISAEIYSTSGKKVMSDTPLNNNQLDISVLQKNVIYFIKLTEGDTSKTVKFIKL